MLLNTTLKHATRVEREYQVLIKIVFPGTRAGGRIHEVKKIC